MKNREVAQTQLSIIIPTYNESKNIIKLIKSIFDAIPENIKTQAIVVDDNSPDQTAKIVEDYFKDFKKLAGQTIDVLNRKTKNGLSSAILDGISHAKGDTIVVMDADLSHPPQIIPKMLEMIKSHCDIVVASRYISGGHIKDWTIKRKIMSKTATKLAQKILSIENSDPMSGFFAFKKNILNGLKFDALGYKILMEILVKTKGVTIKEIPYTFSNRNEGGSKLDNKVIFDYLKSIWKLYRYGKPENKNEKRKSINFISKAARFFTVGASGLGINYLASLLFSSSIDMWYLHATILGIIFSISSNFILNKYWTFEDKDFTPKRTMIQYGKFTGFSSVGALIQLGLVYYLVEAFSLSYPTALILAVGTAAFSNFILNKKLTFKEKIWS